MKIEFYTEEKYGSYLLGEYEYHPLHIMENNIMKNIIDSYVMNTKWIVMYTEYVEYLEFIRCSNNRIYIQVDQVQDDLQIREVYIDYRV